MNPSKRLGNRGPFTTFGIVRPVFRQIEPDIDQTLTCAPAQRGEHPDLKIADLRQASVPLPGNTRRCRALFRKGAFIEDQDLFRTAQQRIGFPGDLFTKPGPVNDPFRQQILQGLMIDFIYFALAQYVGPFRLEKSAQIAVERVGGMPGGRDEK